MELPVDRIQTLRDAVSGIMDLLEEGLAAEPGVEAKANYAAHRQTLMENEHVEQRLPPLILRNPDLLGALAEVKSSDRKAQDVLNDVRSDIGMALLGLLMDQREEEADAATSASAPSSVNPDSWTGVASRTARLVAARNELAVAKIAIDQLIADLEENRGNGGPPLDEHDEAIDALRRLHATLGELLGAIDRRTLNDELGEGLAAEIARFGPRAVEALKEDPARYVFMCAIMAILSAAGFPGLGGTLTGIVGSMKKKEAKR